MNALPQFHVVNLINNSSEQLGIVLIVYNDLFPFRGAWVGLNYKTAICFLSQSSLNGRAIALSK